MADETAGLVIPVGLTEKQYVQQLARLEARTAKMEKATVKNFDGVSRSAKQAFDRIDKSASGMSNSTRASLQNAGYQIQDIIVQIQGGQGVVRALSQQLPQLLGGLGLVGVAAGIAAPFIVALGAALISSGNNAEDTEKQMKSLAQAIDALEAANKKASQSAPDLSAQFGPMADQARELYAIQKQLAELSLTRELNKAASIIGGSEFGSFDNKTADQWEALGQSLEEIRGRAETLSNMSLTGNMTEEMQALSQADDEFLARNQNTIQQLAKMQTMFGVNAEQAGGLAAAFQRLNEAKGADNIASAAAELRARLVEARKTMDLTNESAQKLVDQLINAEEAALRAKSVDMAAPISAAASEAKRLSDELSRALSNAQALSAQGIDSLTTARINEQYRTDPVGRAGALAAVQYDETRPEGADAVTMKEWLAQRREYIATQVEVAKSSERVRLANEADRKAAQEAAKAERDKENAANRAGKAAESAQERYNKAVITLQGSGAATQEQIAAYEALNLAGGNISTQLTAITEKQKLLTAARKAGIELTPEQLAAAEAEAKSYAEQVEYLNHLKSVADNGRDAMNDLFGSVLEGADAAKEAVANLINEIAKVQFSKGMMGLLGQTSWGSGLVGTIGSLLTPNAKGGVYDGPGISAYSGSVVDRPTIFPFAKGTGLMGEAGPEAILPLSRMANGALGVKSQGTSSGQTSISISIDATGAKGNAEIEQAISRGISKGLASYDAGLPDRVRKINANPRTNW